MVRLAYIRRIEKFDRRRQTKIAFYYHRVARGVDSKRGKNNMFIQNPSIIIIVIIIIPKPPHVAPSSSSSSPSVSNVEYYYYYCVPEAGPEKENKLYRKGFVRNDKRRWWATTMVIFAGIIIRGERRVFCFRYTTR